MWPDPTSSLHVMSSSFCLRCVLIHACMSHLQVENDEDRADEEYEDDFLVLMQPVYERLLGFFVLA